MLLIIEDDKMINSLLGRVLQDNGYETESAFDGAEGLKLALEKNYELILLDLMLPQKRGEEVIDAIRKVKNIPVIVLSAKTDVANRIELLRLGVDDYICKPFDVDEVVLRIEAVLRRNGCGSALENTKLQYKCVTLDQDAKRVFVGEEELLCTGMEYSILQILLCNPGKLFTKRNLFESITGEEYMSEDNTMNVHMSNLRKKIAKLTQESIIETVYGMGYRLAK